MAPRASKTSGFLKKCDIAVIGGLGKDAKISDVEKWIVNNGGAYSLKVNKNTTHVVCAPDTYKNDNYALPKLHAECKKLHFVTWPWLEASLQARRVKPAKPYMHPRSWEGQLDKKAVRRRAILTGKTIEEVDTAQLKLSDQACVNKIKADGSNGVENETDHGPQEMKKPIKKKAAAFQLDTFIDEAGITWNINLKGSELITPENGDYILTILVTNGEPQYYRAQYSYAMNNLKPDKHTISVGSSLTAVRAEFESFYESKTGKKWSDRYAELQATARSQRQDSNQSSDVFHDAKSTVTTSTES